MCFEDLSSQFYPIVDSWPSKPVQIRFSLITNVIADFKNQAIAIDWSTNFKVFPFIFSSIECY
jgi:hypothetical protein